MTGGMHRVTATSLLDVQIRVAMNVLMEIGDTLMELQDTQPGERTEQMKVVIQALRLIRDDLHKGPLQ
jgi:hypothetical protein